MHRTGRVPISLVVLNKKWVSWLMYLFDELLYLVVVLIPRIDFVVIYYLCYVSVLVLSPHDMKHIINTLNG